MISNEYSLNLSTKSYNTVNEFGIQNKAAIQLANKRDLKAFLDLFLVNNLSQHKVIKLIAEGEILENLEQCLNDLGYAHLYIKNEESHKAVSSKINALYQIQSKKWEGTTASVNNQYNNAISPIKSHIKALQSIVLPPISFQSLVQTYRLRTLNQGAFYSLDLKIDVNNYELNKKEFLFLRTRIEKSCSLYDKTFVNNPQYDQFSAVLFDMLTAEETNHLILDQLSKGIFQLKVEKSQFETIILKFKNDLFHFYHRQIEELLREYKQIEQECQLIQQNENADSMNGIGHKILSKLKSSSQNHTIKKQLVHRFIQLKNNWNKTIFSTSHTIKNITEWRHLVEECSSTELKNITWGKFIQHQISAQISRLTYNNSHIDLFPQEEIEKIKKEIGITINEVNKNKIFKRTIEDNTLYLKDTLGFIDQTIMEWQTVMKNSDMIKSYHPWRKFWDNETLKVKKICAVLFSEEKNTWLWNFENWYFRLLIESNMSSKMINSHKPIEDLMQLNERMSNIQKASLLDRLTVITKNNIATKRDHHISLKKWKIQSQFLPIVPTEIREELIECFPLIICNNEKLRDSNTIIIDVMKGSYEISFHQANHHDKLTSKIYFEPSSDKSIIQSKHSQRWEQIREISEYLTNYHPEIGFHESKDLFVLTFFNSTTNTTNIKLNFDKNINTIRAKDYHDFATKMTESLLDNQRQMCFETMDGCVYQTDNHVEVIRQHRLIEFLRYIGLNEIGDWSKDVNLWLQNVSHSSLDVEQVSEKKASSINVDG